MLSLIKRRLVDDCIADFNRRLSENVYAPIIKIKRQTQRPKSPSKKKKTLQDYLELKKVFEMAESSQRNISKPKLTKSCWRLSPVRKIETLEKRGYLRGYARNRTRPFKVSWKSETGFRMTQFPMSMKKIPNIRNERALYWEKSEIDGWGLFALELFPQHTRLFEYAGERIREAVSDLREENYKAIGLRHLYLFRIDTEQVIDATVKGGLARFLNHSCNPNCESYKGGSDSEATIFFRAIKAIYPHKELSFNYLMEFEDRLNAERCFCGSKMCTGYLNYQPTEEERLRAVKEIRAFDSKYQQASSEKCN